MHPAKLGALVARSAKPIYHSPSDIPLVARGLVGLASYMSTAQDLGRLLAPVRKFARRDASFLAALLTDAEVVSPSEASHGQRAALIMRALPAKGDAHTSGVLAASLSVVKAALEADAWALTDLRTVLLEMRHHGGYDEELCGAVARLVRRHVKSASASDVVHLVSIATLMPEVYDRDREMLDVVGSRVALVADELSPADVGTVCRSFNRIQLRSGPIAVALQEEADRVAQGCDARTSVELLLFICRQEARHVSGDSVQWLVERVMGEALDATAVLHLCRALRSLPLRLKQQLTQDLIDVVAFVSSQVTTLLVPVSPSQEEPGSIRKTDSLSLGHEATQLLLTSFLGLHKVIVPAPADLSSVEGYLAAVEVCAGFISDGIEELPDGAVSLSFGLVGSLLEAPSRAAQECGVRVVREMARECVHLPALQTFRTLLSLGDAGVQDAAVTRYLRGCFCKTAADIPPAQLCTALRCFVACGCSADTVKEVTGVKDSQIDGFVDAVEAARVADESAAFFRFTTEVVRRWFSSGLTMRFALSVTEALYLLGCRDEAFYEDAAALLDLRRATATPRVHSSEAAETVCLALGEDTLDKYPDLHSFLLEVQNNGVRGEAKLTPSVWMDLYDPANAIVPLTEQQQDSWEIVEKMVATRADDRDTLVSLAQAYLSLLPFARPDDHKYFFGVFEEKVLKEDKLLKECLDQLGASGITPKLSATTIGAILHSLAALRFAYPRSTRRFLEGVSDEQWREMDPAPLVQVLAAMARLSLRMPPQLAVMGERVAAQARFLSPFDIADAIRSFQALGHTDEVVLQSLVATAASRAKSFDEVSLTTLFAAPAVHRLLRSPDVAVPLLQRACAVVVSPNTRQKIATKVRRSGVSRDLLESCSLELRMLSEPGRTEATLRLT